MGRIIKITYAVAAIFLAVYLPVFAAIYAIPGVAVLFLLHRFLAKKRAEKIEWASVDRPFFVVDYGKKGRRFRVPEPHIGYCIAAHPGEVEEVRRYALTKMREAGNNSMMDLEPFIFGLYFRIGEHVLESQEEYEDRIFDFMDAQLQAWHIEMHKRNEAAYLSRYIASGRMLNQ